MNWLGMGGQNVMRILIGVDQSPHSERAVLFVSRMRWPAGSRVIVASVMTPPLSPPVAGVDARGSLLGGGGGGQGAGARGMGASGRPPPRSPPVAGVDAGVSLMVEVGAEQVAEAQTLVTEVEEELRAAGMVTETRTDRKSTRLNSSHG